MQAPIGQGGAKREPQGAVRAGGEPVLKLVGGDQEAVGRTPLNCPIICPIAGGAT